MKNLKPFTYTFHLIIGCFLFLILNVYTPKDGMAQNLVEFDSGQLAETLYNDARNEIITALQEQRAQLEDQAKNAVYQEVKKQFEERFQGEIQYTREFVEQFLNNNPRVNSLLNDYREGKSQEVVSSLQGLLDGARNELNQILELNDKYENEGEEYTAEYMEQLNSLGIKGRWVDKVGEWEVWYQQFGADKVALAKQLYEGFEGGQPGGQLNLMFDLMDQFSSNVPILGRFIQLYAEVGREMLNAAIRTGDLLRKFDQGCLGSETHGNIPNFYNLGDPVNINFTENYPNNSACPSSIDNIFVDSDNNTRLYFWMGGNFLMSDGGAGMRDIVAIQAFLRLHDYGNLAEDLATLHRIYDKNFTTTSQEYEQVLNDTQSELIRIEEVVRYFCDESAIDQLLTQYGGRPFDSQSLINNKQDILDDILVDLFIHDESAMGEAWKEMKEGYSNLFPVSQRGNVVVVSGTERTGAVNATVNITGSDIYIDSACSELTTDENGSFKVLFTAFEGVSGEAFFEAAYEGKTSDRAERLIETGNRFLSSMTLEIEEEEEIENPIDLTVSPASSTLTIGETENFSAFAVFTNDSTVNVTQLATWENGSNSFTATEAGETTVTASYMGLSASAVITVEEITQCDEPSEILDEETGNCVCNTAEGYEMNEELGKCINIDEALEEVTEEGDALCDEESLLAGLARLDEIVASGNRLAANFRATVNKFMKEVNDQNSDICENTIIAAAFAGAKDQQAEYQLLVDEATSLSTDLILESSMCPLEDVEIDINSILQKISQLGPIQGEMEDGLAMMEDQLQQQSCDTQEVEDQGDTIAERDDPELIQAGGTGATEICGDGIDNDGNGLIDDGCAGASNFNVTISLYDSGNLADDVFGLSVSGQGNLGNTPEGGLRVYPLRLSPGSYVATITVIKAPDNQGTYTISIMEGSQVLNSSTGSPSQGSVIDVPFSVGGNSEATAETESMLPMLMNSMRQIDQTEGSN